MQLTTGGGIGRARRGWFGRGQWDAASTSATSGSGWDGRWDASTSTTSTHGGAGDHGRSIGFHGGVGDKVRTINGDGTAAKVSGAHKARTCFGESGGVGRSEECRTNAPLGPTKVKSHGLIEIALNGNVQIHVIGFGPNLLCDPTHELGTADGGAIL